MRDVWGMSKSFSKFSYGLPKTCLIFISYKSGICKKWLWDNLKIWLRCDWDFSKICQRFEWDWQNIWLIFIRNWVPANSWYKLDYIWILSLFMDKADSIWLSHNLDIITTDKPGQSCAKLTTAEASYTLVTI